MTTTILARSPSALLRHLDALASTARSKTVLFALSPNVPPSSLSKLVTRLTTLSDSTVGCLSAPLVSSHISCSLAFLPPSAVPFRSTLPGRAAPQVGRWHSLRSKNTEQVNEYSSWADVLTGTKIKEPLPSALQNIQPSGVVYFTDSAPEGLLSSLEAFPNASSLGLIASSTPFITGRPVTLFHNDAIYDSGAVGVALTTAPLNSIRTSFRGVIPISVPMTITQREGNMINALDGTSPAQLLLAAIRQSGMDMDAAGSFKDDETFLLGTGTLMYRITAGDPSRGNISLEPQNVAPPEGTLVQFFHLPKVKLNHELETRTKSSLEFLACSENLPDIVDESDGDLPLRAEGSFIAGSENGFVLRRGHEKDAWTCTAGYSSAPTPATPFDCDHNDDDDVEVVEQHNQHSFNPTSMGQSSSRQQRLSTNSAASASSTAADPQPPSQPTAPAEPGSSLRRSVRNSLLNLVRSPPAPVDKRSRKSRAWRSSRRWSKAPELPDPALPEQSSESSSSSSATLPLGPIDEKAESGDHQSNDDVESHDLQGEASSSPASSSEQPLPAASPPISEPTVVDDSASVANLDAPEAPDPAVATPEPVSSPTETTESPTPAANTTQHQFPPPGTLVVVQGVVHTTDVPRPSAPSLQVPDASPRSSSTPPSTRNRLSTLLHSRPSSRASFAPSSTTIDTPPLSDDPAPPPPAPEPALPVADGETGPISSGSIDVLGTLLSVAAAATAASLLTGTTEPLHLPSNIANAPSASPEPSTPRPTSPTPTSGLDTTRAERLRQAWGGIRERLGLRPHPTTTSSSPSGTDTPSDAREHLFGQMARAFNLGLGLTTENASLGPRDSTTNSSNPQDANDANTTAVSPAEPPAEGSFERFLLDLQTDLRAALSPPSAPADTTPATNSADPEPPAPEPESEPEEALSSHDDDDDGLYDDMPTLGEVSDSDSESEFGDTSEDTHEEAPSVPSSPSPNAARASLPDVDAQGRINWWRLYRFAPITVPPNAQPGQGIPTALLPTSQSTNASTHPSTPPQPTTAPPPLPLDPTLAELPFFDDIPDVPQSHTQAQVHTVVPVIVVGVQSVVAGGRPQATGAANNTEHPAGTGAPEEPAPAPEGAPTEGNRGRGWHSRAAEAFRNLRPGRRNRNAAPTTAGSRTFLIYVIGGYYPPNHSILNGGPETLASLEALLELADLLGHTKSPTVTKEDLEKSGLEIIKATQVEQYEREDKISYNCTERCLICLDDYQPEDDIRLMKCRHAFHQSCVDKWLETGRNNCPACRSKGVSLDGTTDA